jgi:Flp pilus assembly protein TadG
VLMIPLIAVVGCAVDYARVVQYKSDLQNAVDEAALAGAAALTAGDTKTKSAATTIAKSYFSRAILPASLSVSAPNAVADNSGTATLPNGNLAYTVQVSASATISNTLFSIFIPSVTLSATATAAEPLVTADLSLGQPNAQACDKNTLSIYEVPQNSNGTGYDYSISALSKLATTAFITVAPGAKLPSLAANQPLGIRLQNQTGGICGDTAGTPNPYGAPGQSTNYFYSSLLQNGMSPSESNNPITYTAIVTTTITASKHTQTSKNTQIAINPTNNPTQQIYKATGSGSLTLSNFTGSANCSAGTPSAVVNGSFTTTYTCTTVYKQEFANTSGVATAAGNCSLYVQTGVSSQYVSNLTNTSVAPAASSGKCSPPTQAGAQYAAPTCAQMSALANGGNAPAAVFWWNDGGGSGTDDYDYNDAYFAATCTVAGGNADGNTEVVLVQ